MALYPLQGIADLDEQRIRKERNQPAVVVARRELSDEARLRVVLAALQYNQGFVTFTDGKANTLLLVNSIFLATTASTGLSGWLSWATLVSAAAVVLLCLAVVWARASGQTSNQRGQLFYFEHILRRRNPVAYQEDFGQAGPDEVFECTARQVYELASVVARKFRAYRTAQLATLTTASLWIANLVGPALRG